MLGLSLSLLLAGHALGQDHTVVFETEATGEYKGLDLWGLDTAWLWDANVIRGVQFMGKPQVDVIRFSFTGDTPIVDGDLTGSGVSEFNERMRIVDTYTEADTVLYLNNDTENWESNPYLGTNGVNPSAWAELIAVTAQKAEDAGRAVISVAPFNEPDHGTWQGDVTRFGDVCWWLRWSGNFPAFGYGVPDEEFVSIMGGNTLSNDAAASWYNTLNDWGFLEEGNTHQLAGSFDNYAAFYQSIEANGDVGTNDELHNVAEAMVGAEYGMDVGIWWGSAERARGEFVKASDGMRLAYAEDRPNWTAASVYRAPDGKIQAFVGESERQARPTTYRFFSKDRPVFYDGHGPQRAFDVTTTGADAYWTDEHRNAERVVNITWGEDVQPVIDGRYYLVNRQSLDVMEVTGASLDNGANIGQNAFNGNAHQQWDVVPAPRDIGGDYSYFAVTAAHSEKAPDVHNWSLEDGGNIAQWEVGANPGTNQQWFLDYVEDGWFTIGSRWSGLYLAADGTNVAQQSANGQHAQQWRLVPVGADPTDIAAPAKPKGVNASANAVSVQLNWNANTEGDLAGYTVLRSTTSGGPYEIIARGLNSTSFTDGSANQSIPYYYVVRAEDLSLNRSTTSGQTSATPTGEPALVAHYAFQCDAQDDSINGNHCVIQGEAHCVPGGVDGSALSLNEGYVSLPAEVANHDQLTIASWVYWDGGASWQRIFDFGNGTEEHLFLTPANWDGVTMQFTITHDGVGQSLYTPAPPVGQWTHIAVTLDGQTARLYVDGSEATSSAVTIKASDFNPVLNYIGKSQFPDPSFNGAIDEFRIYNYALGAAEVADLATDSNPVPPPVEGSTPITLVNPSFEQPNTGRLFGFDSSTDVPGWQDVSVQNDSGVEPGGYGAVDGSYCAWLMGQGASNDRGTYQMTGYTIQSGDEIELNFSSQIIWGWGEITAELFWDTPDTPANVIGSATFVPNGGWWSGTFNAYTVTSSVPAEAVGRELGIRFVNTGSANDSWVAVDAVSLAVKESVPHVLVKADSKTLWPANHKMRDVEITLLACDGSVRTEDLKVSCFISSSEPDNGADDGNTTGDVNGSDGYTAPVPVDLTFDGANYVDTVQLRAERSDSGTDRVYTIVCDVTDPAGNIITPSCEVTVPLQL